MTQVRQAPSSAPSVGAEVDLLFTDLLANGQAVGRAAGLVIFCFGPLPGERARVRITALKPTYGVGEIVRNLDASPDRAEPFCLVFGACGGCQVQHLAYPAQLRWKRELLRNALQRIGGIDAEVRETIGMRDPRAYRNKFSLVVERRGAEAVVGFYRARSHEIVPIDRCPVVVPQLDRYIGLFACAPADSPLRTVLGEALHVVARQAEATGEAVISVTTPRRSDAMAAAAPALLKALPGAVGVVNSFEPASANAVLGRSHDVLAGRAEIQERIGEIRYRVSATSFFQINREIVARIFEAIESEPMPGSVVDLYCGMGTFSLLFARRGAQVLGIEENRHAVTEARANARLNGLHETARFQAARVESFAASEEGRAALAGTDLVFLDPPRKGSDTITLGAIAAAHVARVAYLSCDPATLARDSKFLVANGYDLTSVQPFDMFPQTGHVEALVILRKN
ncbi:MAG TPA: 23S rRNA (uracil(1939)-C(5))-methyltransferase RlmD [Candidatus Tyrphobacter sp.]